MKYKYLISKLIKVLCDKFTIMPEDIFKELKQPKLGVPDESKFLKNDGYGTIERRWDEVIKPIVETESDLVAAHKKSGIFVTDFEWSVKIYGTPEQCEFIKNSLEWKAYVKQEQDIQFLGTGFKDTTKILEKMEVYSNGKEDCLLNN